MSASSAVSKLRPPWIESPHCTRAVGTVSCLPPEIKSVGSGSDCLAMPCDAGQANQCGYLTGIPNAGEISARRLFGLIEWLSGNECRHLDEAGLIRALVGRLRALPLPVDYVALYLRTLHPEIRARIIVGSPEAPIEVYDSGNTRKRPNASPNGGSAAEFIGCAYRTHLEEVDGRQARGPRDEPE
jgi:hypothetical protein